MPLDVDLDQIYQVERLRFATELLELVSSVGYIIPCDPVERLPLANELLERDHFCSGWNGVEVERLPLANELLELPQVVERRDIARGGETALGE